MEKQICRWSYFLGIAGVFVAMVWRVLTMFSLAPKGVTPGPHTLTYDTVMQGALLLLLVTVATSSYLSSKIR